MKQRFPLIPTRVLDSLSLDVPPQLGIVVGTVDDRGLTHFALVSCFEVLVHEGFLYLVLYRNSRTSAFLARRKGCSLAYFDGDIAVYFKCELRERRELDRFAVFRMTIREIKEDRPAADEPGTRIAGGLVAEMPEESVQRRLAVRRRVMAEIVSKPLE